MAKWFVYFILYSFLGYLLEKIYALATHSNRQVRKCFLLLPLCRPTKPPTQVDLCCSMSARMSCLCRMLHGGGTGKGGLGLGWGIQETH